MIKILPGLITSFLMIPSLLIAQDKGEELLDWSDKKKLTWHDYKAQPDPESDAAASTTTYLSIEYNLSSTNFGYTIQSRFSKTRSWGLHKTPYILSHEQGHFDIAEIFARKLNMKMSAYRFDKRTYQKELSRIYNDILEEKEEMQNAYDKETRHSINKEKQAEWLDKINKMMEAYKDFANY